MKKNGEERKYKITLLFLFLIPFISAEIVDAEYNITINKVEYNHTNGDKEQAIRLFSENSLPISIKVTVIPVENTINPHLCVSNTDQNCKEDRIAW